MTIFMHHILVASSFGIVCVGLVLCTGCDQQGKPTAKELSSAKDQSATNDESVANDRLTAVDQADLKPLSTPDQSSQPDESSPEGVLRKFMIAMIDRDVETIMQVGNGDGPLELLLSGAELDEESKASAKEQVEKLVAKRLEVGDTVTFPSGASIELDENDVNESRLKLVFENNPVPFDLLKFDDQWYVNVDPIIAVKKAEKEVRAKRNQ